MNEAKYPSTERIERDGVLIHAEGDDLINDPDEAKRQGYDLDTEEGAGTVTASERIERDGVLIAAEGDEILAEQARELGIKADKPDSDKSAKKSSKKS